MALKRKKNLEKNLLQIDGTLSTIELQREALCNATSNTEVVKVMGEAAKALKKVSHLEKLTYSEAKWLPHGISGQSRFGR